MRNYLLGLITGALIAGGAAAWAGAWRTPDTIDACVLRHIGQLPSASGSLDFYGMTDQLRSICAQTVR